MATTLFDFGITDIRTQVLPCGCCWYFAFFGSRVARWFTQGDACHARPWKD